RASMASAITCSATPSRVRSPAGQASAPTSAATSSSFCLSRPERATRAPSAARVAAIAWPRPSEEPRTRALLPESPRSTSVDRYVELAVLFLGGIGLHRLGGRWVDRLARCQVEDRAVAQAHHAAILHLAGGQVAGEMRAVVVEGVQLPV